MRPVTRARSTRLLAVAVAVVLPAVLLTSPARADVAISQQVVMIRDVGPFKVNYREGYATPGGYLGTLYGFATGTLTYSMKVYKLKEGVKKYDYFLLDVTSQTSNRKGEYGRATFRLGTDNEVNYTNYSTAVKDSPSDCKTFPLNVSGTVWPGVSIGTTVGHIKTCGKDFSMSTASSSTTRAFVTKRLNHARQVTTQKWIRVGAGKRPDFRFQLAYGYDTCAQYGEYMGTTFCVKKKTTNKTTKRYAIPTTR
jgi:hypothetical protein